MDGTRFNELVKQLAQVRITRIDLLRGLVCGTLGAIADPAADGAEAEVKKTTTLTTANCLQPVPRHRDGTQGLQTAIDTTPAGGTLALCASTWNLASNVVIFKALTLVGAGVDQTILDGGGTVQVLHTGAIGSQDHIRVQGLTITKGHAADIGAGGIGNVGTLTLVDVNVMGNTTLMKGGGIWNSGTLTVIDSRVTANSAFYGAGIFNDFVGTVSLEGSSVTDNTAYTDGGGICNDGTLLLISSSVSGNAADRYGGGIVNRGGMLTLEGSDVSGNTAREEGGGISNSGTLSMGESSVVRNAATVGGGIWNSGGMLTLEDDSRVTGNTATQVGGGIFHAAGLALVTVSLEADSRVTGNQAGSAGGGVFTEPGSNEWGDTVNVANKTIVTNNTLLDGTTPSNCAGDPVTPPGNCAG